MEMHAAEIETLFHEKVFLYRELLDLMIEEKQVLEKSDLDKLWKLSSEKQLQATRIGDVRRRILAAIRSSGINPQMDESSFISSALLKQLPSETVAKLTNIVNTINASKDEIRNIARQNMEFVKQYLSVLDEMFALITAPAEPKQGYSNGRARAAESRMSLLLHKEV